MSLKAPEFWQYPSWKSIILSPLGALYNFFRKRRQASVPPHEATVPVICIGNLTIGGAGKTPTVIALVEILKQQGQIPHIISRGYGGKLKGPVRVDHTIHTYQDVGDEPLLLSHHAPTWVAKDRVAAAQMAIEAGATVLLLDDGFQNPSLKKDLSFIVVNTTYGFGNGALFPAGPLREPIEEGLSRAQAIILIGEGDIPELKSSPLPIFRAHINSKNFPHSNAVVGFSGIAYPEKFKKTLLEKGYDVRAFIPFPDHHPFNKKDLKFLQELSRYHQATLITTMKDVVRLPEDFAHRVLTLSVTLEFGDEEGIKEVLEKI